MWLTPNGWITIRCTRRRGPRGFWKQCRSPRPGDRCRYHAQSNCGYIQRPYSMRLLWCRICAGLNGSWLAGSWRHLQARAIGFRNLRAANAVVSGSVATPRLRWWTPLQPMPVFWADRIHQPFHSERLEDLCLPRTNHSLYCMSPLFTAGIVCRGRNEMPGHPNNGLQTPAA